MFATPSPCLYGPFGELMVLVLSRLLISPVLVYVGYKSLFAILLCTSGPRCDALPPFVLGLACGFFATDIWSFTVPVETWHTLPSWTWWPLAQGDVGEVFIMVAAL